MRERIFGLEVEYSLSHMASPGGVALDSQRAAEIAIDAAHQELRGQGQGSLFWPNGGKLYHDMGHIEWASPECRSVREAVVYDRAGERFMEQVAGAAERWMNRMGHPGTVFVAKNNVDAYGNTFGSHENYLVQRTCDMFGTPDEFFAYVTTHLVPFLVSRTILSGNGYLDPRGQFQISQRAPFMTRTIGSETRTDRAIVNTRDESHADSETYRRLHLILGDANMCEWATFLKLGTTAVVLTMIEEGILDDSPELQDPVAALHDISRDPTLTQTVRLRNGASWTALDIQRWYLDAADRFHAGQDVLAETALTMTAWRDALDLLGQDPAEMAGKLDWVTKLESYPFFVPGGWGDPRLRELDFKYHSVRTDSVLRMLKPATIIPLDEIDRAVTTPPPLTRARVRGEAVRKGLRADDWTTLQASLSGGVMYLTDPFDWLPPERLGWAALPPASEAVADGLASEVPEVRRQAIAALAREDLYSRARPLAADSLRDADPRVRAEAVKMLGAIGVLSADECRIACADPHYLVRLHAWRALQAEGV